MHRAFIDALRSAWRSTARPEQLAPPGAWSTWVFCGGRGAGKTRSGAEWVLERVAAGESRVHLVAPTVADVRDVMLEGPAGLLTIAPTHLRPIYQPTLRKLTWPNGAQALLFSGDEPERLRGPQCGTCWIDELCAMRQAQDVLDNMYFGLRVGADPRCLITTTPRPHKYFRELLARDGTDVIVTKSSSFANRENLPSVFFAQIVKKYAGSRLERQELLAELLTDTPGALWHLERIEELRVRQAPAPLERVVVAIDPAVSFGPDADETGIIVAGLGHDGATYLLDDLSGRYPPEEWARRAIIAYRTYSADRIIAEVNQGGDLVEKTLRSVDASIPYRAVHASRGKLTRAEPVSALYEQGRVHHVGAFGPLEDQMTSYDGSRSGASPDRLDALCWAVHELMLGTPPGGFIKAESMLRRAPAGAAEPIEQPPFLGGMFASIAAGLGPQPDLMGIVIFGFMTFKSELAPALTVLEWDLLEINSEVMGQLGGAVQAAFSAFAAEIKILNGNHADSPVIIDPAGVGEALLERMAASGADVNFIEDEALLATTLQQRIVRASGRIAAGDVALTRAAHEQTTECKRETCNHLLRQIAAFGVAEQQAQQLPGALLIAFANGILQAASDPQISKVMSSNT